MRIAVISDIHGNGVALRKALESIEKKSIDLIVCLGDICYGGPEPLECLKLIQSYVDYCVIGNSDSTIIKFITLKDTFNLISSEKFTHIREEVQWVADNLGQDNLQYLASLPLYVDVPIGSNMTLKMFHGNLSSNNMTLSAEDMIVLGKQSEDSIIYAFGHTHQPYLQQYGNVSFLNPGSIGATNVKQKDGSKLSLPYIRYAIVDTDYGLSIEFVQLDMSLNMLRESFNRSSIPNKDDYLVRWGLI
jgi:putative phosphoesterase